ncbi:MAG TPA: hypothetical protein VKE51_21900 [Vicinamibacterales bacterium]|nr:hypothetical protein [Vicinamibacterales bacterium]
MTPPFAHARCHFIDREMLELSRCRFERAAGIDAFMRNVNWAAVIRRIAALRSNQALPAEDPSNQEIPSISVEELAAQLATGSGISPPAKTLRERGFDARYIRGGVSAWSAAGGPRAMRPTAGSKEATVVRPARGAGYGPRASLDNED